MRSIAKAVARGLPRVYVCEGRYDEAVAIRAPVAVFGGLTCAWELAAVRPILSPLRGVALEVVSSHDDLGRGRRRGRARHEHDECEGR